MTRDPRLDAAYDAARMYYGEGRTMESIAEDLTVSRSTVSRLLNRAREAGLVQISLRPPGAHRVEELRRRLAQRYGVQAHVVPVGTGDGERERLQAVAERSEEHTSELQSRGHLVSRLMLDKRT